MKVVDGIKVIGICELLEELGIGNKNLSYDGETEYLKVYLAKNNFHYYGEPRENFFEWAGVQEAIALGKAGVVVEDLS